jgi:hypothetical protein
MAQDIQRVSLVAVYHTGPHSFSKSVPMDHASDLNDSLGELWVSKRSRPHTACGTSELGFLEEDIAADFSVLY